jgi:hypothetical protein
MNDGAFKIERRRSMKGIRSISMGIVVLSLASACSSSLPRASPRQPAPSDQIGAIDSQAEPSRKAAGARSQSDDETRKRGYRPASYRGERVYCRNEVLTGSNLETKVCLTAKQVEDQERAGKDTLNGNRPAGCTPTKGGCN